MKEHLVNHDENTIIESSLRAMIKPWGKNGSVNQIESVSFSVLELSRRAGFSVEKSLKFLPSKLEVSGETIQVKIKKPKSTPRIKALIRQSVKEPPIKGVRNGGRSLDEKLLEKKIIQAKKDRTKIYFKTDPLNTRVKRNGAIENVLFERWSKKTKEIDTANIQKGLKRVEESLSTTEGIARARWDDLAHVTAPNENKTVSFGLEFCPLYTAETTLAESRIDKEIEGESSILKSRVGNKWSASKRTIEEIKKSLEQVGLQIAVKVIFADIGVFAANKEDLDPCIIEKHFELYRFSLGDFCQNLGINLEFSRLSEIIPSDPFNAVNNFIVPDNNGRMDIEDPEKLLDIVNMKEIISHMDKRSIKKWKQTLSTLFNASNGNISVFRGLVNTYVQYDTTQECDIHLGIERSDGLLALQSLASRLRKRQMPSLNILVK